MRTRKKQTLSFEDDYVNINSLDLTFDVTESYMRKAMLDLYDSESVYIDYRDVDIERLLNHIMRGVLRTEQFEIVTYGGHLPFFPIPLTLHFNFESNKDMNLYKLKNPAIFESYCSERLRLLKRILK